MSQSVDLTIGEQYKFTYNHPLSGVKEVIVGEPQDLEYQGNTILVNSYQRIPKKNAWGFAGYRYLDPGCIEKTRKYSFYVERIR